VTNIGDILWEPPPGRAARAVVTDYLRWLEQHRGVRLADHDELWAWSVEHLEDFWASVWDYFQVTASVPYSAVLGERRMPGAQWFPGARLNWAEHTLRHGGKAVPESSPALIGLDESLEQREMSWVELRRQVGAVATALREMGVRPGDRVAALLPNIPEAVVALLATAAVGGVWSCCAPDFGVGAAADRLGQVEPTVLLLADGYVYGGRRHDRRGTASELAAAMPTVRHTVWVPYVFPEEPAPEELRARPWSDLVVGDAAPTFEQVPSDHPLWILYTSGTTGLPKGIVQGHAGILVEHLKWSGLYFDLRPGDRFFFSTSTAWMVWNALVSGLLSGATLVLYDGAPNHPDTAALWRVAAATGCRVMGTGAGYVTASRKAGLRPGADLDLSRLETLVVTGSPLPLGEWSWVYDEVSSTVRLDSASGGTEVCAPFVGGAEILPVRAGEIAARLAGVKAECWDDHGRPTSGEGELVVTRPMPSMPLYFWNDPDGTRYREAYFDTWPGVWRHGDRIAISERGTVTIAGRSDATLNRHGVRMGSSDIYDVVERLPEVRESLVVGVELPDGGYYLPLFVVPADDVRLDDELCGRIRSAIRDEASPRHVPDEIIEAPGVPHTMTGKRLEVPVKRLLQGVAGSRAANADSVDSPEVLSWYVDFAARRRPGNPA
jgi:acetoacetyl-CoA synthetase